MAIYENEELRFIVKNKIENASRINEQKDIRYWYPLSVATYGVDEIIEALNSLCAFRTSMHEKTRQFEINFAKYQGSSDAVMVNSGSSADLILCMLLTNPIEKKLEKNDEILIPAVTWPTQIWSAMMAGLKVRLVDVDPQTINIDIEDLESSISSRTRAISLVHVMGNPCDMDRIMELANKHDLIIIEDCCEAMGATWDDRKVGNFGVGGTFSFFFSHHITTMEGGMVSVTNPVDAEHIRIMRSHGWLRNQKLIKIDTSEYVDVDSKYTFVNWGLNVRPTELQASFGIHQLKKSDKFSKARMRLAKIFNEFIVGQEFLYTPLVANKASPSWFALPLMINKNAPFKKSDLISHLERDGVETRPMISGNLARQPVAAVFPELRKNIYPGADEIHAHGFYIGLSPIYTDEMMGRLIEVFVKFQKMY